MKNVQIKGAIHNPKNDNHFMVIQSIQKRVRVFWSGKLVAESQQALRVLEFFSTALEPRIYLPLADLQTTLVPSKTKSHCPLKGDAFYFAIDGQDIAWGYQPFDFAQQLDGYVAFWGEKLRIEEGE